MNFDEGINDQYSSQYIDLLGERVGGRAIACSDEWFAGCANLVKPGRGVFKLGHFVDTGQWMDGWETRRSFGRRQRKLSGRDYDWAILHIGVPGGIRGFDIDTNHFRGNAPEFVAVEAANRAGEPDKDTSWTELLPKSSVQPHSQNLFDCNSEQAWTHLRLKMYPDGGIARFRAYGIPNITRDSIVEGELIDLASVSNGGMGIEASDMFFSSPSNLVMPGRGVNMGDGWETKRRRDDNNDWAIVKLGIVGDIRKVIIDTAHFKGNYPDSFSLEAANTNRTNISADDIVWQPVIDQTMLDADCEHLFAKEIRSPAGAVFTHVRLNIFPDGGVSRLRIFGTPNWEASGVE